MSFISLYFVCAPFCSEIERCQYKSHWNILVFCYQWKMMSDLNMSQWKISDFVSFSLLRFTLVLKQRNLDFESHWNTLIFFSEIFYSVRFEYAPWKNVWFCFISIGWVYCSRKTGKFWFESSLKYFDIFG